MKAMQTSSDKLHVYFFILFKTLRAYKHSINSSCVMLLINTAPTRRKCLLS